jgi:uncharacterized repeat protein (TIGR01451 family)
MCLLRFAVLAAELAAALLLAGTRVEAQSFGLSVTTSASSLQVSNTLTYTIDIQNLTGFDLTDTLVTNTLPASVQIVNANATQGIITTNGSVVVFELGEFLITNTVELTLTVEPTAAGLITNMIQVVSLDTIDAASSNVVVQVTSPVFQADLGVAITLPTTAIIANDVTSYGVTVSNLGPSDAPGVVLTNTLPPGVLLKSVAPANQTYTLSGGNLIFNLGTVTNGAVTNLQFVIQPTNSGTLAFSASIGAPNLQDTDTTNNAVTNTLNVIDYLPGTLVATVASAQVYNPQDGLVEQTITVSNAGAASVPAARVVVTGLTNQLYNAGGTNGGNPFVVYGSALAPGQGGNLLLQFEAGNYFTLADAQLQAFAVPAPDFTPPAAVAGTNFSLAGITRLANGNMLIEFPSTPGRTYTVVYSDNVLFSNAMIAPPAIVAPANRTQWIDYGPPTTLSAPNNRATRFYRVLLNP